MMLKNKEDIITKLKSIIGSLRRYAHSPDCANPMDWPEDHDLCKFRLNLDSAIAWELANLMSHLLDCILYPALWIDPKPSETIQTKISETIQVVTSFYRVVNKFESYGKLKQIMKEVFLLLYMMREAS